MGELGVPQKDQQAHFIKLDINTAHKEYQCLYYLCVSMKFDDYDLFLDIKHNSENRIIFHVFKSRIKEVGEEVEIKQNFTKS